MKFSIVVPIYNASDYLEECLNSILNQTYVDFECIMVDDGSTDSSGSICDKFVDLDSRFFVIHQENKGNCPARKTGANFAKGDYILNVDSDDFIEADLLINMAEILKKYKTDAIYFGYVPFGGKSKDKILNFCDLGLYEGFELEKIKSGFLYDSNREDMNSGNIIFSLWCKCVRRELYVECLSLVPDSVVSGEDMLFLIYLHKKINSVYVTDYTGYHYRQRMLSIEHKFSTKNFIKLYELHDLLLHTTNDKCEVINSVNIYLIYRFWFYCCGLGLSSKSYSVFHKEILKGYDKDRIKNALLEITIKKPTFQSKIKIYLLKKEKWFTIYWLAKKYFKNRLGV